MFRSEGWIYEIVKELIDGVLYSFLVVLSTSEIEKGSQTKNKGYNIQEPKRDRCCLERF